MKKTLLIIGNAISSVVVKIPETIRTLVIYVCLIVLNLSCYVYLVDNYWGRFVYPAMLNAGVGILSLAILIIIGMDREYTEDVFNKSWLIVLFLSICGAIVVISGMHHNIGYSYIAMGLMMLIMMPVYCLVWGDKEHLTQLFTALARVIVILYLLFFAAHVLIAPNYAGAYFLGGQYMGMGGNPNGTAKVAVTGYIGALYLLSISNRKSKYLYAIVMGMSVSMLVMTASRANVLAVFALTFFYLWIKAKNSLKDRQNIKDLVVEIIIVIVICAATVPLSKLCLEWQTKAMQEEQAVELQESVGVFDRLDQGINEDGTANLDGITSGRLSIWKDVIKHSKLLGIDKDEVVFHSHNTVIELLKRSGWIAAIAFFLVEVLSAIWILVTVFSKKKVEDYQVFAVMGITAFGIASLFDIVVLPFAKTTTLVFYLCFAAMCVKRNSTMS